LFVICFLVYIKVFRQLTPCSRIFIEKIVSRSASQIIRNLWNPKVLYRFHKSPSLDPVLSQINPFHIITPCSVRLNIVLASTHKSSKGLLRFKRPVLNFVEISQASFMLHVQSISSRVELNRKMYHLHGIQVDKSSRFTNERNSVS
jgi:hypothetical protein